MYLYQIHHCIPRFGQAFAKCEGSPQTKHLLPEMGSPVADTNVTSLAAACLPLPLRPPLPLSDLPPIVEEWGPDRPLIPFRLSSHLHYYTNNCVLFSNEYIYIFGDENSSLKGRTVYGRSVPYPNPIWLYIYIEREIDIHKEVAVMRLTGVELSPPVICSVGSSQRARCTTCITRN